MLVAIYLLKYVAIIFKITSKLCIMLNKVLLKLASAYLSILLAHGVQPEKLTFCPTTRHFSYLNPHVLCTSCTVCLKSPLPWPLHNSLIYIFYILVKNLPFQRGLFHYQIQNWNTLLLPLLLSSIDPLLPALWVIWNYCLLPWLFCWLPLLEHASFMARMLFAFFTVSSATGLMPP